MIRTLASKGERYRHSTIRQYIPPRPGETVAASLLLSPEQQGICGDFGVFAYKRDFVQLGAEMKLYVSLGESGRVHPLTPLKRQLPPLHKARPAAKKGGAGLLFLLLSPPKALFERSFCL